MKYLRILFLSLILPIVAEAQMSGRGKIITVQGDTIECIIEIEKKQFCEVVKYKKKKEDRFEKFPLSYLHKIIVKDKIYENLFFVKEDVQGGKIYTCKLCICVVDGYVKLYKESITMFYSGMEGIIDNSKVKPSERDLYYIVKGNGNAQEMNPRYFNKQSKKIFAESIEIVKSINENKESYKDIVKIVEGYNDFYNTNVLLLTQK
jgi:hypothetical protein